MKQKTCNTYALPYTLVYLGARRIKRSLALCSCKVILPFRKPYGTSVARMASHHHNMSGCPCCGVLRTPENLDGEQSVNVAHLQQRVPNLPPLGMLG